VPWYSTQRKSGLNLYAPEANLVPSADVGKHIFIVVTSMAANRGPFLVNGHDLEGQMARRLCVVANSDLGAWRLLRLVGCGGLWHGRSPTAGDH
jgi:hypothetical protein